MTSRKKSRVAGFNVLMYINTILKNLSTSHCGFNACAFKKYCSYFWNEACKLALIINFLSAILCLTKKLQDPFLLILPIPPLGGLSAILFDTTSNPSIGGCSSIVTVWTCGSLHRTSSTYLFSQVVGEGVPNGMGWKEKTSEMG